MPLKKGCDKVGENIKEMEKAGHPPAQAKAAALDTARKSGCDVGPKPGKTETGHGKGKK